jgi:hypothetical protein
VICRPSRFDGRDSFPDLSAECPMAVSEDIAPKVLVFQAWRSGLSVPNRWELSRQNLAHVRLFLLNELFVCARPEIPRPARMGNTSDGRQSRTHRPRSRRDDDGLCAVDETFFRGRPAVMRCGTRRPPATSTLLPRIKRHPWATMEDSVGSARPGCAECRKPIYTADQWMEHLQEVAGRMGGK